MPFFIGVWYTGCMTTITIPGKFPALGDLIAIPREEYEALRARPSVREYTPTPAERRALTRARRNFRAGKTISLAQLERDLDRRR